MMEVWMIYSCLALGLLSALVAGVFQAFSDFVMRGLALGSPASGIESMQGINKTVFRSVFLSSFFLLVPITLLCGGYALLKLSGAEKALILTASASYIVCVFLVTVFGNVPMNEKLAKMPHTSKDAENYWKVYCRNWTRWNHVRTLGSVVTAICFLLVGFGDS